MDSSSQETDAISGSSGDSSSSRYSINLTASSFMHSPITSLLEYSGLLQGEGNNSLSSYSVSVSAPSVSVSSSPSSGGEKEELLPSASSSTRPDGSDRELTIRIVSDSENEEDRISQQPPSSSFSSSSSSMAGQPGSGGDSIVGGSSSIAAASNDDSSSVTSSNSSSSSYQSYDIQSFARWVEQILPFSLLLVLVFIHQHLQGFCVALWIAVVLYKSNDVLRKQTALKGERKKSVLLGMISVFLLHVLVIYWWYCNDGLLSPLLFIPPKTIPPFWHALFIIVVNDAIVRLVGMAFKCVLLLYYKNSRGQNHRKRGQMLTLVEYVMLVYRALLPAPVWYCFFLNKEYGSFFSSLVTGLYLTIKLTSSLSKVQLFFAALRALSCKEMHYGSYATAEQVNAASDLCAICQEKMQAPILLRCKHIFCEDCVSEWFERERTCPLCRALVKPADIRSYSDGSTSLLFQMF